MTEHIDNEGHAEALESVKNGSAVIATDMSVPAGRLQVIAHVMGDREASQFVLTEWHQALGSSDWVSRKHMVLDGATASRLVELLHSAGLAAPPHLVDGA